MRKYLHKVLFLALLLWGLAKVSAQEFLQDTVTILVTSENPSALSAILQNVINELALNDLDVNIVTAEQAHESINLTLTVTDFADQKLQINIDLITPPNLEPSSILHSRRGGNEAFLIPLNEHGFEIASSAVTGFALYSIGRLDLAYDYLNFARETLPELAPNLRFWWYNGVALLAFYAGNCALVEGKFEQAVDLLKTALYILPGATPNFAAHTNLAWSYLNLGLQEETFLLMDSAIQYAASLDFPVAVPFSDRAQLYALVEQYPDAITDLTAALELDPTNPEIYSLRGQMYRALYEWDSALADFNAALELDPIYAEAYYQRGLLYASILQTGAEFYDEALADFQHYLELAPDGEHAAEAAQYITDLQSQQQSLNE